MRKFWKKQDEQIDPDWMPNSAIAALLLEMGVEETVIPRSAVEYAMERYSSVRILTNEDTMRVTLIGRR